MSLNRQNIAPCKENGLGESNDSVTHNFNLLRFCACAVKIRPKVVIISTLLYEIDVTENDNGGRFRTGSRNTAITAHVQ